MFYDTIALFIGVLALAILLLGVRVLFRRGWVLGWLRGMVGVAFVFFAFAVGLVGLDLRTYHQLSQDQPIATVSFERLGPQRFTASFVTIESGAARQFDITGDQWQLDARIVRWKGLFRSIGGKPGYRLDRMSGRFLSLQDERFGKRSVHSLYGDDWGFDFWAWVYRNPKYAPWIEASYGSATYVPMADGAIYEIGLSNTGLAAKPLNDAAKRAVYYWD